MALKKIQTVEMLKQTPVTQADLIQLKKHLKLKYPYHILTACHLLEKCRENNLLKPRHVKTFEDLLCDCLKEPLIKQELFHDKVLDTLLRLKPTREEVQSVIRVFILEHSDDVEVQESIWSACAVNARWVPQVGIDDLLHQAAI